MRIHLIHPCLEKNGAYKGIEGPKIASLSLTALAAATPPNIEVRLMDERIRDYDFRDTPDLAGITFMSRLATRAYWIAGQYRARGIPVVVGGIHASMRPREAMRYADAVVVGEAERLWPELIEDFRRGRLKKIYQSGRLPIGSELRPPRRDLLESKRYASINTIEATRGCPHNCSFCYSPNFHKRNFRTKPVAAVVAEIRTLKGKLLIFVDDNLIANPSYAKALFTAMIPLKKLWFTQCSLKFADDDELVDLAVRSGCRVVLIGFETLSHQNLSLSSKKWSSVDQYEHVIRKLHNKGLAVLGSFIAGFDHDDGRVFERILDFSIRNKLEFIQINPLAFYPGSVLYDQEINGNGHKSRLIAPRWWQEPFPYVYHVHYRPARMSVEDLENGCVWTMKEFYTLGSILKRLRRCSLPLMFYYWLINLGLKDIGGTLPIQGYNPGETVVPWPVP